MSKIIPFPGAKRPVATQAGIRVNRETVLQAYAPDARNGDVWVTESYEIEYDDGVRTDILGDFIVLHMADDDGDSASWCGCFETLKEAQAAAVRIARERNAVLS